MKESWQSGRVQLAKSVLQNGALVGDVVPVRVVLEEDFFGQALADGVVSLLLLTETENKFVCRKRVPLRELVCTVEFATADALFYDCLVYFAVFIGREASSLSGPSFVLGAPPTLEEIALARQLLEEERLRLQLPKQKSSWRGASPTVSPSSSPRGILSTSPRGSLQMTRSRSTSTSSDQPIPDSASGSLRVRPMSANTSPRHPDPRALPPSRGTRFSLDTSEKLKRAQADAVLETKKMASSFSVGQSVMALCKIDQCWHHAKIIELSDWGAALYFPDFESDQPDTSFNDMTQLTHDLGASSNSMLSSMPKIEVLTLGDSSTLGATLEEELNKIVSEIHADPPESQGLGFGKVLRDFVALRQGQMSVKQGEIVDILRINDNKWAQVMSLANPDQVGLVPLNSIEKMK